MTKPEYFNGTEWKSFCSEGAPVDVQNEASSPFPITGSLIIKEGTINADLGPELDALAIFNQNGLVTRTGDGTYAGRELIAGNGIEIENGNGVNGNPIISATVLPDPFINDLPINGNLDLGSFDLITTGNINAQTGFLIGNNLQAYNVTNILLNSPIDMQGQSISNLQSPTNPNDAATKNYVDTNIGTPFINDLPINGNLDLDGFNLITDGDVVTQYLASPNTLPIFLKSNLDMQNNAITGLSLLIVSGDISCRESTFIGNNIASFNSTNIAVLNPLDLQNNRIIDLALPIHPNDAVPKQYIDNLASWFINEIDQTILTKPVTVTNFLNVQSDVNVSNGSIACEQGDINCRENKFIGNNIAAFNLPSIAIGSNLDLQKNRILTLPTPVPRLSVPQPKGPLTFPTPGVLNEPATKGYVDGLVSDGNVQRSVVEISSSQILNLDNCPVSLVQCPTGYAILPYNVVTIYIPGTQEYDDKDLDINIAIGSVRFGAVDSNLFKEDDPALDVLNLKDIKVVSNSDIINQDLIIYNKDSGLCKGNGTLKVVTWYSTFYLGDIT